MCHHCFRASTVSLVEYFPSTLGRVLCLQIGFLEHVCAAASVVNIFKNLVKYLSLGERGEEKIKYDLLSSSWVVFYVHNTHCVHTCRNDAIFLHKGTQCAVMTFTSDVYDCVCIIITIDVHILSC